jgi:hypothetical protein
LAKDDIFPAATIAAWRHAAKIFTGLLLWQQSRNRAQ